MNLISKKERDHNSVIRKPNFCINGDFTFDQRYASSSGTPVSGSGSISRQYIMDRWAVFHDEPATAYSYYRNPISIGTLPGNPSNSFHQSFTTSGSGGSIIYLEQVIEGVESIENENLNINFYATGNFTTLQVEVTQVFGTGGSPSGNVTVNTQSVTLSDSLTEYNLTYIMPSIAGKILGTNNDDYIRVRFIFPLHTSFTFDLTSVSFIKGDLKSWHEVKRSYQEEISLCQRYFEKSYDLEVAVGTITDIGSIQTKSHTTAHAHSEKFMVLKRDTPSIIVYNPTTGASGTWREAAADKAITVSNPSLSNFHYTLTSVDGASLKGHWAVDSEL